jgi:hypothetical protein
MPPVAVSANTHDIFCSLGGSERLKNMDDQIIHQYVTGGVCILIGLSGWFLPYRWNVLRFRRLLSRLVSERVNRIVPKVVGSILVIIGLIIVLVTLCVGKIE